MSTEVERIQQLLIRIYEGDAWHGPAIQTVLNDLSAHDALRRAGSSHNSAELVLHMAAWRNFVIRRLSQDTSYELPDQENWVIVEHQTDSDWEQAKRTLEDTQQRLLASLGQVTDDQLSQIVEGRTYNYYVLLHGSIQHDLYHLGQIRLLSITH